MAHTCEWPALMLPYTGLPTAAIEALPAPAGSEARRSASPPNTPLTPALIG
jgi:hypothetical protein